MSKHPLLFYYDFKNGTELANSIGNRFGLVMTNNQKRVKILEYFETNRFNRKTGNQYD